MINKVLSKTLMPFFAAAVLAAFSACGDEITEVTQIVGMQVVEEGDALPKCTTDNEGALVYSVDSAAAYYCVNRKWTTMKGKDGKDGADGKDGKNGVDGKNGKDGKNGVDGKNGENGKDGNDGKNGTNGENGKDGKDGKSCTVVAIDNGYKIVCGEDSVGVLLNGEDGQDGAKGDTGVAGSDGKNCEIVNDTNGTITLKCGDNTTTLYKAMCNLIPYDPTRQYCSVQGVLDLKKCGGKLYNPENHFCDNRDSSLYRYVTIGSQIWMAENLNYKVDNSWCGGGRDKNEGDCTKYGRLYAWTTAIGRSEEECGSVNKCELSGRVRGVCPEGWHLPDTTEWNTLLTEVGKEKSVVVRRNSIGERLKSQTGWNHDNGMDAYGFSALPAGNRYYNGYFNSTGYDASFWSASEYDIYDACEMYVSDDGGAGVDRRSKYYDLSVRCLKDSYR